MSVSLVIEVALLLPIALAVGWIASRTLGVRQSSVRIFATGLVGWGLGVALANWSVTNQPDHEHSLEWRVAIFSVLATMAVSIALDFFARPGAPDRSARLGRLPDIPHPIRRVRRTVAPARRFREVLRIARREGLFQRRFASIAGMSDSDFGAALRRTLEASGGMFIKLGQAASTRTDLLPAPVVAELAQLQSSVAPAAPEAIRNVLEAELGRPPEEVFPTLAWQPMAAASIGQVHRARLSSGEHVVVKVQRPGIDEIVERDSDAMMALARFVQRRTSIGLRLDVIAFVREFTDAVKEELDFAKEGRTQERIRTDRGGDKGVHIPHVYLELTSRRAMVCEEIHGRPVSDERRLAASPVPRHELADRLLTSYLGQILQDGVFHADPHPGNVLLGEDGTLYLLDFGSTGVLDAVTLEGLGGILLAASLNDPSLLERAVLELAPAPAGAELSGLTSDLGRFLAVHVHDGGAGFDVGMLKDMIELLERHHLAIPTSLTLLSRTLVTLDGTLHIVCPGYPLAERAGEIAPSFLPTLAPRDGQLRRELLRTLPALRNLPSHAEAVASQLRTGRLVVRTRSLADPADAAFVRSLVNRAVLAAVGLAGLLTSGLVLLASADSSNRGEASILRGLGYTGLLLGTIITMRVVARIARER